MLMHERGGLIWGLNKLKGHPHAPHLMTLDLPCAASPCMLLVDDFHYFFFLTYLLYIYMLLVQGSSTKPLRHMHHASKIPIYLIIS
jgi:hypothetical protein